MSDLGEILITLDFDVNTMSLKMWLVFRIFSTLSDDKQKLDTSDK